MTAQLHGVLPVFQTPYHDDETLDPRAPHEQAREVVRSRYGRGGVVLRDQSAEHDAGPQG